MVDQQPAPDFASAVTGSFTDALRELAGAVRELAGAVRDSAAIVELVPYEDGECGEDDSSNDGEGGKPADPAAPIRTTATVYPLIPAQDRTEPAPESLCRPGGCGCADTGRDGQGRHARRETPPVPADSTLPSTVASTIGASADSAAALSVAAAVGSDSGCYSAGPSDCSSNVCDGGAGI